MTQSATRTRRLTRGDALSLAVLALLACALMAPFLLQGRIPLNADFALVRFEPWWRDHAGLVAQNAELDDPQMYIYPIRELSAAMLKRGIVPLWNPYILCGTPLLADSVSLPFDPFGLIALVLPFPIAWGTIMLAQLLVAGWSMYALVRHYGCSRPAAVLSGATLMLCGTFTVWLEYLSWIGTFCWAPLCLLCLDVGVRRGRTLPFVGAAVLMSFTILGGLLQLALYFLAMMGFYALWQIAAVHWARGDRVAAVRGLLRLAFAFALALLLASAQLLPTLELAAMTYRAPGRYIGANHLPFAELVTYVVPNLFGHPAWHDQFYHQLGITGFLFRHGGYLGILPLALALYGGARCWRDARAAAHVVLSFGNVLFLVLLGLGLERVVLAVLPGFGGLHAKRQVVVYSVSAAVLAGFGLDALLAADRRQRRLLARAVGFAAAVAVTTTVMLSSYVSTTRMLPAWLESWQERSPLGILAFYKGVWPALALLAAAWALVRFGQRLGARRWAVALVAFAAVDLLAQARLYNPFVPSGWIAPRTEATDWLRGQPGFFRISGVSPPLDAEHPRLDWFARRYKGDSIPPNLAMPYRLYDIRGRSSLFPFWIREYCQAVTGNTDIRVLIDYRADEHRDPMVHLLSPRFVVSPVPLDGEQFRLALDGPPRIYEDTEAAPRAFFARPAEGETGQPALLLPGEAPGAEIEAYAPNEVRIRVTAPQAGDLVLTDTWCPGWRAFVDGEPRPIARVNHLVRCVTLRDGERQVHLVYEPQAFRIGLFLSLVGVAVVFAALGARIAKGARPYAPRGDARVAAPRHEERARPHEEPQSGCCPVPPQERRGERGTGAGR